LLNHDAVLLLMYTHNTSVYEEKYAFLTFTASATHFL